MIIPSVATPVECDVLIYDIPGSHWLHQCIPETATRQILDVRNQRPVFLDQHFFSRLIQTYFHYSDIRTFRYYLSYISTVFDHIKPRVILTFADNNVVLGHYARRNPAVLVISIQNAIRGTVDSIPPNTVLPIYYALGNAEQHVFKAIKITHQEYIPIGSVKLGLFLEENNASASQTDLSFCSHYRPELVARGASKLFHLIESAQSHLFKLACQFARANNLSVAVLSKTRDPVLQRMEAQYFRDLADGYSFSFVLADKKNNEFATYQEAFSSRLIINLCSTLGYEAFGAGQKVLFGSGYRTDLLSDWGAEYYYDQLPAFTCLQNDSFQEFEKKARKLLGMEDSEYKNLTANAASHYLAMPTGTYPHQVIRKRVAEHLGI